MLTFGEPNRVKKLTYLNSDPNIELLHFTILRPPTKRSYPVQSYHLSLFQHKNFSADISKFNLIIFDQYGLQGILPPKYLENI